MEVKGGTNTREVKGGTNTDRLGGDTNTRWVRKVLILTEWTQRSMIYV